MHDSISARSCSDHWDVSGPWSVECLMVRLSETRKSKLVSGLVILSERSITMTSIMTTMTTMMTMTTMTMTMKMTMTMIGIYSSSLLTNYLIIFMTNKLSNHLLPLLPSVPPPITPLLFSSQSYKTLLLPSFPHQNHCQFLNSLNPQSYRSSKTYQRIAISHKS